jgi:hypothetical protein
VSHQAPGLNIISSQRPSLISKSKVALTSFLHFNTLIFFKYLSLTDKTKEESLGVCRDSRGISEMKVLGSEEYSQS